MKLLNLFLLLGSILVFVSCDRSRHGSPVAAKGFLDLGAWDFERDGNIKLNGEWEFYWNHLYTPEDFKNNAVVGKSFIHVPGSWTNRADTAPQLPGKGFATYHLKVKLNKGYDVLAIKFIDAASSYLLWINGSKVASNGVVSAIPAEMKEEFRPLLNSFKVDSQQLDVVVQVSNDFHVKGGLWDVIQIGSPLNLVKEYNYSMTYQLFLMGVMFILFIYHLWIFFLRNTEKTALYFGLLCLTILVRSLVTDGRVLYVLFPEFNLNVGLRLEYLSLTAGGFFYSLFVCHLFSQDFSKKVLRVIKVLSIVETCIIVFTNTGFYTSVLLFFQLSVLFKCFYFIVVISPKTIKNKRPGAVPYFVCIVLVVTCVINDILSSALIINTPYIISVGFFITVLLQAYILASRISYAFGNMEHAALQLNEANAVLAQKLDLLAESERKFSNIINTISNFICIIDTRAMLNFVNPSFKRDLRYRPEEMEGRSAYEFLHRDDWQSIRETFEKGAHNPRKPVVFETRLKAKNGNYVDVEARVNALYENKKITGAIVVMTDITDRKLLQQTQEEYNRTLELKVEERTIELTVEKKKSDDLLLNILPVEVAEELKQNGSSEARSYENVSVMFTDFVNFTGISERLSPKELVSEIDICFTTFDQIMDKHGLEKIKTIGDAYLAVCGLPHKNDKHAIQATKAANDILEFMKKRKEEGGLFEIRIGIHSGPLTAGIVGSKKFAFDIWGDAVNTANRMESSSEKGKINISHATHELIKQEFKCHHRGKIAAKNKGEVDMYFVSQGSDNDRSEG